MILRGGTDENCRIKLVGRILVLEKIEFRHLSNITLELGSYETILFHSSDFFSSAYDRSIIVCITILGTTCISLRYTNYLTNNRNLTETSISTNIESLQFWANEPYLMEFHRYLFPLFLSIYFCPRLNVSYRFVTKGPFMQCKIRDARMAWLVEIKGISRRDFGVAADGLTMVDVVWLRTWVWEFVWNFRFLELLAVRYYDFKRQGKGRITRIRITRWVASKVFLDRWIRLALFAATTR